MDSAEYWNRRYESGGNSGPGSRGRLAEFKAEVLNRFVAQHCIESVIEFGCGDGYQLSLASYPRYIGFDVSKAAVICCRDRFRDASKRFDLMRNYAGEVADLALSLDVVYHLIEDEVFEQYMTRLFGAARRFVAVYARDADERTNVHVRYRKFSTWIASNAQAWTLCEFIPNRYPYVSNERDESDADFYIYRRVEGQRCDSDPG